MCFERGAREKEATVEFAMRANREMTLTREAYR
jgi:hypothetical protein